MPLQENKVDQALQQIAELSDPTTAVPIVVKEVRMRGLVTEVALGLSYPVRGVRGIHHYPAIHNGHPTPEDIYGWRDRAHRISGELQPQSLALATFLHSLGNVKREGPPRLHDST